MVDVPRMDDEQGAQLIWNDWPTLAGGRIWPWILTATGVLIVFVGAVAFSPNF